jgi:hypothetical protein
MSTSSQGGNGKDGPTGPSLTLLTKLMKLTTSSNDSEALLAMRKANEQVAKFGGDWETILKGKITVIGDPFASVTRPPVNAPSHSAPPPPSTPHHTSTPRSTSRTAPPPTFTSPPPRPSPNVNAQRLNVYAGACTGCRTHVAVGKGMARRNMADTAWDLWCSSCLKVGSVKAPKPAPTINDILSRI